MQRFVAAVLFLMILPLFIPVVFLSLILQGLPLFYIQRRIGLNRNSFDILKLRSMEKGQVTKWGRFLRRTGMDEVPQLVNILRGEMLFVGPRPLTKGDIIRLGWDAPTYDIRWRVKPGITGPAQLSRICSKENTWKLDREYIQQKSPLLDVRILAKSLQRALTGRTEVR